MEKVQETYRVKAFGTRLPKPKEIADELTPSTGEDGPRYLLKVSHEEVMEGLPTIEGKVLLWSLIIGTVVAIAVATLIHVGVFHIPPGLPMPEIEIMH